VFADCDDTFSRNRVAVSRRLLADHPVVANELLAFGAGIDGQVAMLSPLLREGQRIGADDLVHGNVLGMGNTAARIAPLLPQLDHIDPQLVAYDWALFTRVLHAGAQAVFTASATTAYRQHAGTSVGLQACDAASLLRMAQVKALHYRAAADLGAPYPALAAGFARLAATLAADPQQLARYAGTCARSARSAHGTGSAGAWWSAAILPPEVRHEAL
jgi:hypothetical protein